MAVALILAGSAQGDRLQYGHVVADDSGFTDDQSSRVVQHNAVTHSSGGVDVDAEFRRYAILEKQRERLPAVVP